jgi:hypothetical protein
VEKEELGGESGHNFQTHGWVVRPSKKRKELYLIFIEMESRYLNIETENC